MAGDLLEREDALRQMRSALASAQENAGQILLVSGEAGMGKSALLAHFAQEQAQQCRVLWGFCDALLTPRPLGPLFDFVALLNARVRQCIESGATSPAIFDALMSDLAAHPQPSLMLLEDVHWADDATLDLIRFLGRRIARLGAVIVITYRDDELPAGHPLVPVLSALHGPHVHRLPLQPLSPQAVSRLAAQSNLQSNSQMDGLFEKTQGNPFFVAEVLASPHQGVPRSVADAVVARLQRLSAGAMDFCERVSVLPGRVDLALLRPWHDQRGLDLNATLDECIHVGVLQMDGLALRFRHELARLAVRDMLLPRRKQTIYGDMLHLLETLPGVNNALLADLAHHSGRGELVLRYAPLAGAAAALLGAHREAAAHYLLALEHAAAAPAEAQADLNERWALEASLATGITHQVLHARERAAEIWRELGNVKRMASNLTSLSRVHWYLGDKPQANSYADEAIEALQRIPPTSELAMAYSERSMLYMLVTDSDSALMWARRALALSEQLGATEARIHALDILGVTLVFSGDNSGDHHLQESLALALAGEFHEQAALAYTHLTTTAGLSCRLALSEKCCLEGIAFAKAHDLDTWAHFLLGFYSQLKASQGDFAQAQALALASLAGGAQAPVMRWASTLGLGVARSRTGAPDGIELLEECLKICGPMGDASMVAKTCWDLAEAYWLRGRLHDAREAIEKGWQRRGKSKAPWLVGRLLVWRKRLGMTLDYPFAVAEPYQLEMDGDLLAAAKAWQAIGAPYDRATCLMQCGDAELLEAIDIFTALGATLAAELARNRARHLGVRGVKRGPYAAAQTNVGGLTAKEQLVYKLIAQGLSNAEISAEISRSVRTVEHHASNVMSKMGVRNRGELARLQVA